MRHFIYIIILMLGLTTQAEAGRTTRLFQTLSAVGKHYQQANPFAGILRRYCTTKPPRVFESETFPKGHHRPLPPFFIQSILKKSERFEEPPIRMRALECWEKYNTRSNREILTPDRSEDEITIHYTNYFHQNALSDGTVETIFEETKDFSERNRRDLSVAYLSNPVAKPDFIEHLIEDASSFNEWARVYLYRAYVQREDSPHERLNAILTEVSKKFTEHHQQAIYIAYLKRRDVDEKMFLLILNAVEKFENQTVQAAVYKALLDPFCLERAL